MYLYDLFVTGVHWAAMTLWVLRQQTDFCPTRWEERLFNMVVGIVYCFSFFSLKEGPTRGRLCAFYTIMFLEDMVLLALWLAFSRQQPHENLALIITVLGGFILGRNAV